MMRQTINDLVNVLRPDRPVLYTQHEGHYNPVKIKAFPPDKLFKFEAHHGNINWQYVGGETHGEEDHLSRASLQVTNQSLTPRKMETVRHDMVCDLLFGGESTDIALSTIHRLNQPSDELTPDMIYNIDNVSVVVEVGTTASQANGSLVATFNEKLNKYSGYLTIMAREARKAIIFIVIAVGPTGIYSNVEMANALSEQVLYRFKLGLRFEREYHASGLRSFVDMKERPDMVNLRSSFQKFSEEGPGSSKFGFDRATYEEWSEFEASVPYISTVEETISKKTLEDFREKKNSTPDSQLNRAFHQLEEKMIANGGTRNDMKAPIQIPLILPDPLSGSEPTMDPIRSDQKSAVLELWSLATDSAISNIERFRDNDLDNEVLEALDVTVVERNPRIYHRVNVSTLSNDSKAFLAFDGLHAKRYKDTDFLKERRAHTQNSFSPTCDTSDVDLAIKYIPDVAFMADLFPSWKSTMSLLKYANELQNNSPQGISQIDELCNNELFVALWTISTLAAELAVSQRQNCRPNEMVYKRLRGLAYELLIYPTNSNSHIFFCIRAKGKLLLGEHDSTFRPMEYHDGWYYTQLLSVNSSRLENWIKAPTTWLNSIIHWRIWADKCKREEVSEIPPYASKATKLSMLALLISLEDKSTTEEMVTAVRYISMNFFKGDDKNSPLNLYDPVMKMPGVIRSRLAAWLYQSIKGYCYLQVSNLPKFDLKNMKDLQEERNGDKWDDLYCPFINEQVDQCQTVIQVFYLGYAKNKEVSSYENSDFSLIKKILDNVLNKEPGKEDLYNGKSEPDPSVIPGPHEFSKHMMKEACDEAKIRLIGELGENFKDKLYDQILRETIERGNYETLATLKASYNFDSQTAKELELLKQNESKATRIIEKEMSGDLSALLDIAKSSAYYTMDPNDRLLVNQRMVDLRKKINLMKKLYDTSKNSKSCKCHEAVIMAMEDLNTEGCVPLVAISQIYQSLLSTWGGICCYLFKKNQHGGLREIYVLTFYSRLVQLLVEISGRVLCSYFQEEVMTHPTEKIDAVHRHFSEVKKKEVNNDWSSLGRSTSGDRARWSQNINVSCYSFIASQMFPKHLAVTIMKVLSLWKTKKICLPEGVQRMLEDDVPKDDESYEKLRNEFWGREPLSLLDRKGGNFLKTDTGMWQGILHFFSSFQHVLQILHYKKFIVRRYLQVLMRQGVKDVQVTSLVSSDDSLTMMTVFVDEEVATDLGKMFLIDRILSLALMSEKYHCSFFMMIDSVKTCYASTTVFEFNSIFHIGQGSISPAVKKVLCCTNIIQSESFETKGRMVYNSIKDIIEEGCSIYQVHLHQLVCGLLHYQSIGMTTTQLFPIWADELLKGQPDPNLGFYLMDKDLSAGIMGYDFMKYESLKTTKVPLMASNPKLIQQNISGNFRQAAHLLHGSRKRWDRLKEKVLLPGWEDEINENPEVIFKAYAENKHEARLRLCMKACTKGVYEALSNGGRLASVLASSVFIMRDKVMTVRSSDYEDKTGISEAECEKVSLLKLAKDQREASESSGMMCHNTMTKQQADLFYPNNEMFSRVSQTIDIIRAHGVERDCTAFRKCRNHVVLRSIKANSRVSLMVCCRKIWFNMRVRPNRTLVESSWRYYKEEFHWLRDTLKETLATGFFDKVTDIYRFLQSLQDSSSTLHVLCKRVSSSQSAGKINEIIMFNQYPGTKLTMGRQGREELREVTDETPGQSKEFQSMLNLALLYPGNFEEKMEAMQRLIQEHEFSFDQRCVIGLTPVESRQMILLAHLSGVDDESVLRLLKISGGQAMKYFVIEQERVKGQYKGYGCLAISHKNFHCELHLWDNIVIHVSTTNLVEMKLSWDTIIDEIHDAGVKIAGAISMSDKLSQVKRIRPSMAGHIDLLISQSSGYWMLEHGLADKYRSYGGVKFPEITVLNMDQMIGDVAHLQLILNYDPTACTLRMQASTPNGQTTNLCRFSPLRSTGPCDTLSELWNEELEDDSEIMSWLLNQPRSIGKLVEEIRGLKFASDTNPSNEQQAAINFHREGLSKRLLYKGYLMPNRILNDLPAIESRDVITVTEDEVGKAQELVEDQLNAFAINIISEGSVMNIPKTTRAMEWIEAIDREAVNELKSSVTPSNILDLQMRVNEVICPPVQVESAQSYAFLLHRYWDELIDELKERGIIESFSQPKVLSYTERDACDLMSWLLSRPCLASFKRPLF